MLDHVKSWMIDELQFAVIYMDEKGEVVYRNKAFTSKYGFKNKYISIYDIDPYANPEKFKENWDKTAKTNHLSIITNHKDDQGTYHEVTVFTQIFSNNRKKYMLSMSTDMSISRFNSKLLESTERLAHLGGWSFNLQTKEIQTTTQTLELLRLQNKEDLLPGSLYKFFKESDQLKNSLSLLLRKSASIDQTFELKTTPRKFIRLKANPVIREAQITQIIGVFQDVTAQHQDKEQLKFFKEIIDHTEDDILVYNKNGVLVYHSKSVEKSLGYSSKYLETATVFDLDKQTSPQWWANHFQEIKSNGRLRFERIIETAYKTKITVDVSAYAIKFGEEDFNCAVLRDISKLKQRQESLEQENQLLQYELAQNTSNYGNILSKSEAYKHVLKKVNQVAPTETTVLITGESGTGKELLAIAIHENSKRKEGPFIKINCASLPKELFESELFGHKKGAFTGANSDKIGKFQLANHGTIFLDEIGELPIDQQAKLLRVLQEGEFDQVGGITTIKTDVRVIAATNRNLEDRIKQGKFRADLFYRINVFPIHNTPLRERKDDIPILSSYFLEKYSNKIGKKFSKVSKSTLNQLEKYDFPGNIRELENLIERAVIIEEGPSLKPGDWIPKSSGSTKHQDFISFEQVQRDYIIKVLDHVNWRVSGPKGAARILDMKDKTLFAKMKKLGIEKKISLK